MDLGFTFQGLEFWVDNQVRFRVRASLLLMEEILHPLESLKS